MSHHEAACELNKFDDMIRFLSQTVSDFGHLIVVDQHFDVLFRAWCVAEIVEGNRLHIPAKIKVFSQNAVDCNYDRLSLLDVQQCSASSQDDKDFILRKIVDIQAFNLKLQQLVFSSEGLFSHLVDGTERSRVVGRILRRSACRKMSMILSEYDSEQLCDSDSDSDAASGSEESSGYFAILHPMEYERDKESYWTIASALRCFLVVVATVDLALFSGILWQGSPPKENAELESSREVATASMLDFLDASQHAMYCTKVQELAHRGFHLQSLLNFWEELLEGDVMPSFDPRWSQTNDVVRQAIIPSSRVEEGGRALAEIWEERPVLPQNMVTHHWSNSFAHLVGAMLADALERMTYEELAEELCSLSGVTHIRRKLREAQRLESTYWVCAFSVNQHASICGGYGPEPRRGTADWKEWDKKRHDSVSFHRFKLCDCHEPKLMSHQEAACELNKFDDMIRFLSQTVSDFGHLIVVDQHFDVLFRAWCVAEIVEGNRLHIPAKIKVFSQNAVDCNYDRLSLLDVQQCSASSQDDKDFILRKIVDIQAFNLKLQQLVFSSEGLFSHLVDGTERSRVVGRILRRSACTRTSIIVSECESEQVSDSDDGNSGAGSVSEGSSESGFCYARTSLID
ncbi:Centrosomal protein of 76 kDa [Durusdinium trenchii]